jgi:predicted MFS family arabinose efflux permease
MGSHPSQPGNLDVTSSGLTHSAQAENVLMNKYHLLYVLQKRFAAERDQQRRIRPRVSWWVGSLTTFLGLGGTFVVSDFKDLLGIGKAEWRGSFLDLVALALILTVGLFVWWLVDWWSHRSDQLATPEEMLADILRQMDKDNAQIAVGGVPHPVP